MDIFLSVIVMAAFAFGAFQALHLDVMNRYKTLHLLTAVVGFVAFLVLVSR